MISNPDWHESKVKPYMHQMNRQERAEETLQKWISKTWDGAMLINLKMRKHSDSYLVSYSIVKDSNKQEFSYLVNAYERHVTLVQYSLVYDINC